MWKVLSWGRAGESNANVTAQELDTPKHQRGCEANINEAARQRHSKHVQDSILLQKSCPGWDSKTQHSTNCAILSLTHSYIQYSMYNSLAFSCLSVHMSACFAVGCFFHDSAVSFERSSNNRLFITPPRNTILSLPPPSFSLSLPTASLAIEAMLLGPLDSAVSSAFVAMETYGEVMWLSCGVSCDSGRPISSSRVELQPQAAITLSNTPKEKKCQSKLLRLSLYLLYIVYTVYH